MFEAELGGWWLAETSAGVVVLLVSAWFRWFTRSGLVASEWMLVFAVAKHPVYHDFGGHMVVPLL